MKETSALTISIGHSFTVEDSFEAAEAIMNALDECPDMLTLDCSEVERADAAGAQLLVATRKECEARGVKFSFKAPCVVTDMLGMLGLRP